MREVPRLPGLPSLRDVGHALQYGGVVLKLRGGLSLVESLLWEQDVAGSNPVTPTTALSSFRVFSHAEYSQALAEHWGVTE